LVKQTPEGVHLTQLRQAGRVLSLNGVAQSNERVSEFLRNTLYNSAWLERPELVEITAAAGGAGRQRVYNFSMRVSIKVPPAVPVAVAASAAAPAAKAP